MTRKLLLLGLLVCGIFSGSSVYAADPQGLKVAPLSYTANLKKGEKQKGYIDVSNPSSETMKVSTSVRGFKQTDNQGSLEFFTDEQLVSGVKLDLREFTLGPKQAMRMYFLIDGTKLPSGDVYAAVFFSASLPAVELGPTQSVRVGTLLFVTNGTPGERKAEITSVNVPFLQLGSTINGTFSVKNTGNPAVATGFFPQIKLERQPFYSSTTVQSPLIFAGRERESKFSIKNQWPSLYSVRISYQGSYKDIWVLTAELWQLIAAGVVAFVVLIRLVLRLRRRLTHRKSAPHRKRSKRRR